MKPTTLSSPSPDESTEVARLFDDWNVALLSRDPARVAALYAEDAILLPTVSNNVCHNRAEIEGYFVDFMKRSPVGKIIESNVMLMGDVAIHSGLYCFTLTECDNVNTVPARFSFVYRKIGGEWQIVEHHSSQMPESTATQRQSGSGG